MKQAKLQGCVRLCAKLSGNGGMGASAVRSGGEAGAAMEDAEAALKELIRSIRVIRVIKSCMLRLYVMAESWFCATEGRHWR